MHTTQKKCNWRTKMQLYRSGSLACKTECKRNRDFSLPTAVFTVYLETFAGENFCEFHGIAAFCESFSHKFLCGRTERACGQQSMQVLLAKFITLSNLWKVSRNKSFQPLHQWSLCGCDLAHLPHPWTTWIVNSSMNKGTVYVLWC